MFEGLVSTDYLDTLRFPRLAGRDFTPDDRAGTMPVAIVTQQLARKLDPNGSATGKRVRLQDGDAPAWLTVVGVDLERDVIERSRELPVVVDFWAAWCGPCRVIAPILEEIAGEHAGKVRIGKLNVDDAPSTAQQFQVMSIPTLILFKDGEPQKRLVGARGKGQLLEELSAFL